MKPTVPIAAVFAVLVSVCVNGLDQLQAQQGETNASGQASTPASPPVASIPTDEYLAALVADYKAYGLPLPSDNAELIVRRYIRGTINNQPWITYDIVFREVRNNKTVIWAGCEQMEPYQDFELETILKNPTRGSLNKYSHVDSLDDLLGGQSGFATHPVLATAVQGLARDLKSAGVRLLEISRQPRLSAFGFPWVSIVERPADDRTALASVAWSYWCNEFVRAGGDRRPIISRLKFLRVHRPEFKTAERLNVILDMELTCAARTSPTDSLEAAIDALIDIGAGGNPNGRGFVNPSSFDQVWKDSREKNAGFRQVQDAGLAAMPVLLDHLQDFRVTRCIDRTTRRTWHVRIADIVGGMLNQFREYNDEFAFDSRLEEGRGKEVDPRHVLDWWVNVQRGAALNYLQSRVSQPGFGRRQPLDDAVQQTLRRHFPNVRRGIRPLTEKADVLQPKPAAAEPPRDIFQAVRANDLVAVRNFITIDPQCSTNRNDSDESLLYIATRHADSAMVAFLIWHGAWFAGTDPFNKTPLHAVIDPEIARLLVDRGGKLKEISSDGTPLESAIKRSQPRVADVLKKAAERLRIEELIEQGRTADVQKLLAEEPWLAKPPHSGLRVTADKGHFELAELLLKYGADPDVDYAEGGFDYFGHRTPFTYAVVSEHFEMAQLFCRHGADMNVSGAPGDNGYDNLLHEVAGHNEIRYMKLMLEHGADVNSTRHGGSVTPLHIAASIGDLEKCKLLVQYKAVVDSHASDESTPLQFAAAENHVAVCDYLLTQGAKLNLFAACALGKQAEVQAMLKAEPVLLNRPDHRLHWPPLFWAVNSGRIELATFLIKSGADVKSRGPRKFFAGNHITGPEPSGAELKPGEGTTALHLAAERGDVKLTELLLENGADLYAMDEVNNTPLRIAEGNKHTEVINLLEKKAEQGDNPSEK